MSTHSIRPRVVIVGAGFGGLTAARALVGAPVDVIVVDTKETLDYDYLVLALGSSTSDFGIPGWTSMPFR